MKRHILRAISFLLVIFAVTTGFKNETKSVFRLHIIANSDSVEDQSVKLKVRDALLKMERESMINVSSKEDAKKVIIADGKRVYELVKGVLEENGFDYDCSLMIGKYDFPDRDYGDEFYPAGEYEAIRIVLGEGKGHNWWCVMFPPLCIIDDENADNNKNESDNVEFKSIIGSLVELISGTKGEDLNNEK